MPEKVVVMHYMNLQQLEDVHEQISSPIALNMERSISADEFYLCNGAYLPTIDLTANEWLRLRLVHASHDANLLLEIVSSGSGGSACEMWLLATDGIALENPRSVSFLAFAAGSRRDIALRCNGAGTFELTGGEGGGGGGVYFAGVIAEVSVTDTGLTAGTDAMGDKYLWATSKPNYLSDLRSATPDQTFTVEFGDPEISVGFIVATIIFGIFSCACCGLAVCACMRRGSSQVRDVTVGLQVVPGPGAPEASSPAVSLQPAAGPPCFKQKFLLCSVVIGFLFLASAVTWAILAAEAIPNMGGQAVNGEVYTGDVMVEMKVNQVQEWTLQGAAHPFHIHTNHFQLISHGSDDLYTVGDWFDTVPADGVIRFLTDRFTGTLVLHCHRLEHEDQGMMAKVVIAP
jgi:FtsP/CotA-like multicopper oxidase with cupredoxin domain